MTEHYTTLHTIIYIIMIIIIMIIIIMLIIIISVYDISIYLYVYIYLYLYIYKKKYLYIYMPIYLHIYLHLSLSIHIYIYTHIYICICLYHITIYGIRVSSAQIDGYSVLSNVMPCFTMLCHAIPSPSSEQLNYHQLQPKDELTTTSSSKVWDPSHLLPVG